MTFLQLRLNADHVHADWHDFFQIHKHLGPVETALVDNPVHKTGTLFQLGVFRPAEKCVKLVAAAL